VPTANDWISVTPQASAGVTPKTPTPTEVQAAIKKYGGWRTGDDPVQHSNQTFEQYRKEHPYLMSPVNLLEGVGAGVMSLPVGVSQIVHKVIPGIPALPESYASTEGLGIPGKIGKFGEQTAEFLVPASKITKALEAAPKVGAVIKATPWLAKTARIGTDAATAGGLSYLESGGDPKAAAQSAATVGLLGGVTAGGRAVLDATAMPMLKWAIRGRPRPLSPEAIALAKKYNIQLTQGMLGGSRTVQAIEKILGHTVAPDMYEELMQGAREGVMQAATDTAGKFSVDRFAAGDNSMQRLVKQGTLWEGAARNLYEKFYKIAALPQNIKTIVTGHKVTPSTLYDAAGNLLPPTLTPITEQISLPVDVTGWKQHFAPMLKQFRTLIGAVQSDSSPALGALKEFTSGPDVVSAQTAEDTLSWLKHLQREKGTPDKVKWLANEMVEKLQPDVEKAVAAGGKDAIESLRAARFAWKHASDHFRLVEDMSGDWTGKTGQTDAASRLLRSGDASYPLLERVVALDPSAQSDLAKAYLGRVFKKAQTAEFTDPITATNNWASEIGSRTKNLLFTPQWQSDVNTVLELAKRVNDVPNRSETGMVNALLRLGLLVHHPIQAGASLYLGRKAAKALYFPDGASALRTLMTAAPGSAVFDKAVTSLEGVLSAATRTRAAGSSPVSRQTGADSTGAPAMPPVFNVNDWMTVRARGGPIADPLKRAPDRAAVLRSLMKRRAG